MLVRIQKLYDVLHHFHDMIFQLPLLPFWPMAVCRWVEDNAVVRISALQFALHKFQSILHDPTNIGQARQLLVFIGPGHDLLDRLYVCGICSGCCCYQRCTTSIRKKIAHLWIIGLERTYRLGDIIPIDGLLGKNTYMFERGQPQTKLTRYLFIFVLYVPPVRCVWRFFQPVATGGRTASELDMATLVPFGIAQSL